MFSGRLKEWEKKGCPWFSWAVLDFIYPLALIEKTVSLRAISEVKDSERRGQKRGLSASSVPNHSLTRQRLWVAVELQGTLRLSQNPWVLFISFCYAKGLCKAIWNSLLSKIRIIVPPATNCHLILNNWAWCSLTKWLLKDLRDMGHYRHRTYGSHCLEGLGFFWASSDLVLYQPNRFALGLHIIFLLWTRPLLLFTELRVPHF